VFFTPKILLSKMQVEMAHCHDVKSTRQAKDLVNSLPQIFKP
jgi:hypothetical protein